MADLSTLVPADAFDSVQTAVVTIGGSLVLVYLTIKGVRIIAGLFGR